MLSKNNSGRLQIWGGVECTINRVGSEYKDQLAYSGHYVRSGDLEAFADLGIRKIRYPVLWEKHQPEKHQPIDWRWSDQQMEMLRSLGMVPIAGLLHHGSGPAFTNLLDPEFPHLFAAYAYEVASRYPWIEYYTPINEPLTTARFSGLYGLWFPHHRDEKSFYKMLLNQLKGIVLAMEAIRSVNPLAKLVQTEDLGKSHATPLLQYQAIFENDRRLLTFDILSGRLTRGHPQYEYILGCGIVEEEIQFFQDHPCAIDILGLNYYVTSERWLDENLAKYHHSTYGGNGQHQYADTEIVRASHAHRLGFKKLATEIWERYRLPLAVTEVHLHCTREEQLRWFKEIWDDSVSLTEIGVEMKAVTAWALLGSFDWDSLLTKTGTQYESGVFDIKTLSGELRATALVPLIKKLTSGEAEFHPVLAEKGWWEQNAVYKKDNGVLCIIHPQQDVQDEISTNLIQQFREACQRRRIQHIVVPEYSYIGKAAVNPWAVINVGQTAADMIDWCAVNKVQYASFNGDDRPEYGLSIFTEEKLLSFHQINKVLDLMIDGEQGCWIFDAVEIVYKSEKLVNRR